MRIRHARFSAGLVGIVCLLVLLQVGGCAVYRARDRHPAYTLDTVPGPRQRVEVFQAGFGRRTITPPIVDSWTDADGDARFAPGKGERYTDGNGNGEFDAYWLAGFQNGRPATGVHDDIWAIAAAVDDGTTRLVIVALDAIGLMFDDVVEVRSRLPAAWKVSHAVICTTHCHEVPDLIGLWGSSPFTSGVRPDYLEMVKARTVEAIGEAVAALQPARLRLLEIGDLGDGLVNDTRPPYVYDRGLRIMQFLSRDDGKTIGSILSWANHPETTWSRNLQITSDFVGYLRDGVEHGVRYGDRLVRAGIGGTHLYVNGAIGGLLTTNASMTVHDPFLQQSLKEPSHEKARAVGYRVADIALCEFEKTGGITNEKPQIRVRARTVKIPVSNRLFRLASYFGVVHRGFTGWSLLRTEVDLITIGDAWIITFPGEVYPEIVNGGIESPAGADFPSAPVEVPPIRSQMRGKVNFVFGLANDEIGYIIPKTEWDQSKPYLYDSKRKHYGEINSVGPEAGPILHRTATELIRAESSP